ncbi:PTS system mannose-specific IIA component/PTS system mannose-specific IIB component [Ruminiclostridium sufflavum DSM 19573]|uniref:PTS system mannose-specific IIA component/PTS system mannose-specific IIB component n=1 Tax=Ruminiclostridium sufflavum DSM 19573 TaxID=1121337 RepID=A0A318XKD8_9FIRM|nr:PTS sugar transporter subunit IIA [Ruminiclostridium sufflavum]PYG87930.1 PTS system mannose-specific IIA component/PTS system mannose-specific IIB component [Ruminiclostridium sufflavum DSM 19573]
MINILLVTHGKMAEGMYSSVGMLIGKAENFDFVCFDKDMGQDELKEELDKRLADVSDGKQYLIMCDIKGGTPFNVASRYSFKNDNAAVFYGVNLPILIEAIISREGKSLGQLAEYLEGVSGTTIGLSEI